MLLDFVYDLPNVVGVFVQSLVVSFGGAVVMAFIGVLLLGVYHLFKDIIK